MALSSLTSPLPATAVPAQPGSAALCGRCAVTALTRTSPAGAVRLSKRRRRGTCQLSLPRCTHCVCQEFCYLASPRITLLPRGPHVSPGATAVLGLPQNQFSSAQSQSHPKDQAALRCSQSCTPHPTSRTLQQPLAAPCPASPTAKTTLRTQQNKGKAAVSSQPLASSAGVNSEERSRLGSSVVYSKLP